MKVMIIENSSDNQIKCALRIEALSERDKELLDLQIKVVTEKEYEDRLDQADVLILGSGLGDSALTVARKARAKFPWLNIIMYVTDKAYAEGAFRTVHTEGVRKALPDGASSIDLLQELIAIQAEFKREGRARDGQVIVVCHAKGGVGATSVVAALAEVFATCNRRTMIWDLDTVSRDLSRSLAAVGDESRLVDGWINGSLDVSRESLRDALVPITDEVFLLTPPSGIGESIDLVCHTDAILIAQRIIEVSSSLFDAIIVDTAGHMGPATGALLRRADHVLVVIDDGQLGITAVDMFLGVLTTLVGNSSKISFLVNSFTGAYGSTSQLASQLESGHDIGKDAWRLSPVPYDPKAALWPASGFTLFSKGSGALRDAFLSIASELGIVNKNQLPEQGASSSPRSGGWLQRMLGR